MESSTQHTFRTQVGWWYWSICLLLFVPGSYFIKTDAWIVAFLLWVMAIYMASLSFLTRYVIEKESLTVFYGFFLKKCIPISSITSIHHSRNPLSSPALSLRRLLIRYGKYDEVLVSPVDQEAFIAALKAVNPNIESIA